MTIKLLMATCGVITGFLLITLMMEFAFLSRLESIDTHLNEISGHTTSDWQAG